MSGEWRVAVYGTLMRGYENYARWLAPRTPIHSGHVKIPYRMFATAQYPMLLRSRETHAIYVETFAVDETTLGSLDALEEPYGYCRESIRLPDVDTPVQLYVYRQPQPPAGFLAVVSGRWRPPPDRPEAVPPS
jgi:gamma-glutamylcyclotransferase (GGCT)/AIG2-like uncharacterized protein YtfP